MLRIYWVDPGDMQTQMLQEAFPDEDISDRPLPEESVPGLMALIEGTKAIRALPCTGIGGRRSDDNDHDAPFYRLNSSFPCPLNWKPASRLKRAACGATRCA